MRGLVSYTDYLLVATGQTPRQTKAIAEEILLQLKERHGARARKVEGEREGEWVLIDMLDWSPTSSPRRRALLPPRPPLEEAPQQEYAATAS